MINTKFQINHVAIYALILLGLIFVFVLSTLSSKPLFAFHNYPCQQPSSTSTPADPTVVGDELETALAGASTVNKTVIIAVVNKAYVEGGDDKPLLDLFLESFWLGEGTRWLVDHLLLVTVDQTSYERCRFLRLHCYKLKTDGVDFDGEQLYMSQDFINMMWRRTLFLLDVLNEDADVMWLRNPFPRLNNLSVNETIDLHISTDQFNGKDRSESNNINTGFYMIKSNNRTISLFESWYDRRINSTGLKGQDVLVNMLHEGVFRELGLNVRFLNTLYFSGFCQDSRDIRAVTTVHANCCRTIAAKVADLTAVIQHWKRFQNSATNETGMLKHDACSGSWKDFKFGK
ncbi:hypothetical protein EZV62_019747 [Acer yangbiense]|uniref:Nucleotide-diphospho-sugar transferase domain-containing protein n=1 Tax=Acer yangbiense TaxID=1000413 RepID=A0A5C7HC45_9ROSI|nr:hypothetical protein EZV62_019747 [Acer yangbiense]